jgi:hypothetical protein
MSCEGDPRNVVLIRPFIGQREEWRKEGVWLSRPVHFLHKLLNCWRLECCSFCQLLLHPDGIFFSVTKRCEKGIFFGCYGARLIIMRPPTWIRVLGICIGSHGARERGSIGEMRDLFGFSYSALSAKLSHIFMGIYCPALRWSWRGRIYSKSMASKGAERRTAHVQCNNGRLMVIMSNGWLINCDWWASKERGFDKRNGCNFCEISRSNSAWLVIVYSLNRFLI